MSRRGLLYLHMCRARCRPRGGARRNRARDADLRDTFDGALIVNGGYDARSGAAAIARGEADLVAYGVPFLANPDLPARYWRSAALNSPDQTTFYAGEEKGYIDYPGLERIGGRDRPVHASRNNAKQAPPRRRPPGGGLHTCR